MKKQCLPISIFCLLVAGCQPDSDLQQANAALSNMATNASLSKSCFSIAYPQGSASDFVNYVFSDLGRAEWPIVMDAVEQEQLKSAGHVALPQNVVVSALERKQPDQKELVLQADDGKRLIQVQGYLPGKDKVAFKDQWGLGDQATVDLSTQKLCQSSIEMGVRP